MRATAGAVKRNTAPRKEAQKKTENFPENPRKKSGTDEKEKKR